MHEPSDEKNVITKDSFYEELEQAFHYFPKCNIKLLLGICNTNLGIANIFKLRIGNDSLHRTVMLMIVMLLMLLE